MIWTEINIINIIFFRVIFGSLGVWEFRSLDDTDVGGIRDLDSNYYNYYNSVSMCLSICAQPLPSHFRGGVGVG